MISEKYATAILYAVLPLFVLVLGLIFYQSDFVALPGAIGALIGVIWIGRKRR